MPASLDRTSGTKTRLGGLVKSKRVAVVLVLLTVLLTGLFATRLWAQPNPADQMPLPVAEKS
jgi:hypothetical protein